LWLWKKEDFLNGGSKMPVTFNDSSQIAVYISRYWKDYEEARFVVQDGNQFFISESTFGGKTHTLYHVNPTKTRWSKYDPKAPYDIFFKRENAKFAEHIFKDIQAAGWYITKHKVGKAALWVKWYGFTMDAVVNGSEAERNIVPMSKTTDGMLISKKNVTYQEWRKIYKWAYRNQWAAHENYVFNRDGDMGSMDFDDKDHEWNEPVTDITWLDAVAWCNALSEYEGKKPCYYTDTTFSKVLRRTKERLNPKKYGQLPEVYVDWESNGYRLPTFSEWKKSNKKSEGPWVFCWDVPTQGYNSATEKSHTAIGGKNSIVSFSIIRAKSGTKKTSTGVISLKDGKSSKDGISCWTFPVNANLAKNKTKPNVSQLKMVNIPGGSYIRAGDKADIKIANFAMSSTEIPYSIWKKVYNWSSTHGYQFDYDGDMGSMDWSDKGKKHSSSEPVTDISIYDAMLWCNALSELHGKTPFYYTDSAKKNVYKKATPFRMLAVQGRKAHYKLPGKGKVKLYQKWDSNGYRLPTEYEWEYAYRDGVKNYYAMPWGGNKINENHLWYFKNSNDKTHSVAKKQPNKYGLYDMAGNVFEWTWGDERSNYYDSDNPRGNHPVFKSSSFRTGKNNREIRGIIETGKDARLPLCSDLAIGKPEIGFRIVRCKKGTHPAEKQKYIPEKVIDLDIKNYDLN
jgi:formylglycine-generating enzyme required for sulfatase activity